MTFIFRSLLKFYLLELENRILVASVLNSNFEGISRIRFSNSGEDEKVVSVICRVVSPENVDWIEAITFN